MDDYDAFLEAMDEKHYNEFERKTSHEWYMSLPMQITQDPDGWRALDVSYEEQGRFWHTIPISWKEFHRRLNECTDCSCSPVFPYCKSYEELLQRCRTPRGKK